MNTKLFQKIASTLPARRPSWKLLLEDNMLRICTCQFVVDWAIMDEIMEDKNLTIENVINHRELGIVICIRSSESV